MNYDYTAIPQERIPRAPALFQHALDTYAGETNKVVSVWRAFQDNDLTFLPHPRSSSVGEILKHQLLSERRFFAEFLGSPEPPGAEVLPAAATVETYIGRMVQLAAARLPWIASRQQSDWLRRVAFFDAERERIWI